MVGQVTWKRPPWRSANTTPVLKAPGMGFGPAMPLTNENAAPDPNAAIILSQGPQQVGPRNV